VGLRIALDDPLLGTGPDTYPYLFAHYRDTVLPPPRAAVMARFTPESPHDIPLAIADGAGIPALGAYLAFVLSALALAWRRLRRAPRAERLILSGVVAAVAGHPVTDLFMTADLTGSCIAWALLGVPCPTTSTQASTGDPPA
jgi:O-antigen ligase